MLQDQLLLVISLLLGIASLSVLSSKLKISYPILLVIGGLLISLLPGVPSITFKPDLVFLIFLPPLLYAAAWNTSWTDFFKWRRAIILLSLGLVIFTAAAIAFVSSAFIPGFTLAMGFLLGGIISPPDAVAANSVLTSLRIPKNIITILEGESLINDASGLIILRVSLAAILTGQFQFWTATKSFFIIVLMGILTGLIISGIFYFMHRLLSRTPKTSAAITLISPYIMYITAEHFHFSGVLAVVAGGLFLSGQSQKIFTYDTRLQINGLWEILTFLLNGFVFILIGLQLPAIVDDLGSYSVEEAILYGSIIGILTIIVRIIWVFSWAYLPGILPGSFTKKTSHPNWRSVFLVAWSGMRGVVSLAAALAIPLTLTNGVTFPQRNLILFITFVVIIITLVLQGLSLKPIIRLLKFQTHDEESEKMQSIALRIHLAETALAHLNTNYQEEIQNHEAYKRVKDRYERILDLAKRKLENNEISNESVHFLPLYRQMLIELVNIRRKELNNLHYQEKFSIKLIRERQWELDIEEARLKSYLSG